MTIVGRQDHTAFSDNNELAGHTSNSCHRGHKEKFRWDREDKMNPAVLPEVEPYVEDVKDCIALSDVKGW